MGEKQDQPFRFRSIPLKVGFQGSRVTSDGSLVLVWELDELLGSVGRKVKMEIPVYSVSNERDSWALKTTLEVRRRFVMVYFASSSCGYQSGLTGFVV